jgi:hypothetical protein
LDWSRVYASRFFYAFGYREHSSIALIESCRRERSSDLLFDVTNPQGGW